MPRTKAPIRVALQKLNDAVSRKNETHGANRMLTLLLSRPEPGAPSFWVAFVRLCQADEWQNKSLGRRRARGA